MLFHCLQTQAGIFSNLFVAASFARKLRNLSFPACEASQAWQTEKPESSGSLWQRKPLKTVPVSCGRSGTFNREGLAKFPG
jgi:hypothetical protein